MSQATADYPGLPTTLARYWAGFFLTVGSVFLVILLLALPAINAALWLQDGLVAFILAEVLFVSVYYAVPDGLNDDRPVRDEGMSVAAVLQDLPPRQVVFIMVLYYGSLSAGVGVTLLLGAGAAVATLQLTGSVGLAYAVTLTVPTVDVMASRSWVPSIHQSVQNGVVMAYGHISSLYGNSEISWEVLRNRHPFY